MLAFVAVAWLTRAGTRRVSWALLGGAAAGIVNIGVDAGAHAAGWWTYPDATTSFGPLLYYVDAGLGFGALAIVLWRLERRFAWRAVVGVVGLVCVFGPIRDHYVADRTDLIEFRQGWSIVVADALFEWLLPFAIAAAVVGLGAERLHERRAPPVHE